MKQNWKCVPFNISAAFISSKPLQMIIRDNRLDRAYDVNLRICAILRSAL